MRLDMNFREIRLKMIEEVAIIAKKNEEQNKVVNYWTSMFRGLIQDKEEREIMFLLLFDEYIEKGIASVYIQLKRWTIANRELEINCILEQIHKLEACNDTDRLTNIVGEIFLEDIDIYELNEFKAKMNRQGWTWETLLYAYVGKQEQRVNRILNIPYLKYVEYKI